MAIDRCDPSLYIRVNETSRSWRAYEFQAMAAPVTQFACASWGYFFALKCAPSTAIG
jgi:hypothetical protein